MIIGFDARLINETGVGRYIQNILPKLISYSNSNSRFVIFVRASERNVLNRILPKSERIEVVEFNHRWHGFMEQLLLPIQLYKRKLDVFHSPYINVPVFYFKRKVVTIHDLTVLTVKTGKASTKGSLFYQIKRLGYNIAIRSALRSDVIFTVTSSVKEDILNHFPKVNADKIQVTYNGFSQLPNRPSPALENRLSSLQPYFLYVGNAHPHKNLEFMLDSLESFFQRFPKYNIVIAGREDFFMNRLQEYVKGKFYSKNVVWISSPNDNQLFHLYSNAKCLILPSVKEGFGMQILEAMQAETFIACSKIPPYVEVAGSCAFYFNPKSRRSFLMALTRVLKISSTESIKLVKSYNSKIKNYSWDESAKKTLKAYSKNNLQKSKQLISRA